MNCPTCDHTMAGLGDRWYWCSRCGTTKHEVDPCTTAVPAGAQFARAWLLQPSVTDAHARKALTYVFLAPHERED